MTHPSSDSDSRQQRFQQVLADYLQAAEAGRAPDRQALLAQHPDLADELRSFFANQEQFEQLAEPIGPASRSPQAGDSAPVAARALPPTLALGETAPAAEGARVRYFGDYELLAEIARGGM